jgi:hypothetical protein
MYRLGTPRDQHPAVAWWHAHLRGLATAIHETSGLEEIGPQTKGNLADNGPLTTDGRRSRVR